MRISRQMLGIAAASTFGLATMASAQNVEFHGAVFGCFTTTTCTATPPAAVDDGLLHYSGDSFDNNTALNGTIAAAFSDAGKGSFGHLSLFGNYTPAAGEMLVLEFFFNPASDSFLTGFVGTPDATTSPLYAATVTGAIVANDGGLSVTFGSPVSFAFTDGGTTAGGFTHTGIATITVNSLSLTPGSTGQAITGNIAARVTDTPEPATVALFATGLVGLIPVARRRAKNRA